MRRYGTHDDTPLRSGWTVVDGVERGAYPVRPVIHGKDGSYLIEPSTVAPDKPVEFWGWSPVKEG